MRGSSGDDHFIELDVTRRLAPRVPQLNFKFVRGGADRTEARLQELERTVGEFAIQDGVDLRGDAEAVDVPERTQMPYDAASRLRFERPPNLAALASQRVEDRMPCASRGHRVTDGVADFSHQLGGGARRAGYKSPSGGKGCGAWPRDADPDGKSSRWGRNGPRFQRGDNVRRREARADDQHAIPLLHRVERVAAKPLAMRRGSPLSPQSSAGIAGSGWVVAITTRSARTSSPPLARTSHPAPARPTSTTISAAWLTRPAPR